MSHETFTTVPGVGPATAATLRERGIETLDDLEQAVTTEGDGPDLTTIDGIGPQTVAEIAAGMERVRAGATEPIPREVALPIATRIVERLHGYPDVERAEIAGSLRRNAELVGDIDVLIMVPAADGAPDSTAVFDNVVGWAAVDEVIERGATKMNVRIDRMQVDLRAVSDTFGAALQYFTGPREHNIALRRRAKDRGLTLSEYGLRDRETETLCAGADEASYEALDLRVPPPEARTGEIDHLEQ